MHSDSRYDLGNPRARELTTGATIVPDPKPSGYYRRVVRERDRNGGTVWNDTDYEEEDRTPQGLQYDPTAPPAQYYVLPIMYVPSEGEVQQTYVIEPHSSYATEQYHNQFFTDTRTLKTSQGDDHDGRLYCKEFDSIETEAHPPFVEIKSYRSPNLSFITEPHFVSTPAGPDVCHDETGHCCCGQRKTSVAESFVMVNAESPRNNTVGCGPQTATSSSFVMVHPEPPRNKAGCSMPQTAISVVPQTPNPPLYEPFKSTSLYEPSKNPTYIDDSEKLYVSVDTHTDNTVVESKSAQTQKDKENSCCSTQTDNAKSSNESFHSGKSISGTTNSTSRKLSNDSNKRRTYSILTGQRKSDDNATIDKNTDGNNRLKSTKSPKCDSVCDSGKPCPPPGGTAHLLASPKRTKSKP